LHRRGQNYFFKQAWQELNAADQNQVIDGTGVGNDKPHRFSESQAFEIGKVAFDIGHCDVFINAMGLEEAVELVSGFKAEQANKFWVRDMTVLIFFYRQPFQRSARQTVAIRTQAAGEIIGDVHCQVQ